MALVVFDSDVLIGFLNRDDAHHADAVARMRHALTPGTRRMLCAVNFAEILVGPVRAGVEERVKQMLAQLSIEVVGVDADLAERAATIRVRTNLKLPDAFALAAVVQAERRGHVDVELASFDERLLKAREQLV